MSFGRELQDFADVVIPSPPRRRCSYSDGCSTVLAQSNKSQLCFRHENEKRETKILANFSKSGMSSDDYRVSATRPRLPKPVPMREMTIDPPTVVEPQAEQTVVEEQNEEVTPVTEPKQETYPECAVKDCMIVLAPHNKTGRCQGHYNLRRGMQMKDGSIPRPHTKLSKQMAEARMENAADGKTGSKSKKTLPAPVVMATAEELEQQSVTVDLTPAIEILQAEILAAVVESVALNVPIEALDRFLLRLSLKDKTRIVEREIFGV